MLRKLMLLTFVFFLLASSQSRASDQDVADIKALTEEFCQAIVSKDLSIIDRVFDGDPSNIYYDINEGPMIGLDRLKRIWRAATTNYTISAFTFSDDMKIEVEGVRALQTGIWTQTQLKPDGSTRDFQGRATILWKKTAEGWRAYHYHASITPPRPPRQGGQ